MLPQYRRNVHTWRTVIRETVSAHAEYQGGSSDLWADKLLKKGQKSLLQKQAVWYQIQWFTRFISGFNTLLTHKIEDTEMSDGTFSANGKSPADVQQWTGWQRTLRDSFTHTENRICLRCRLTQAGWFWPKMKQPECTFIFSNNSCSPMTMTKAQAVCCPHCLVFLLLL